MYLCFGNLSHGAATGCGQRLQCLVHIVDRERNMSESALVRSRHVNLQSIGCS